MVSSAETLWGEAGAALAEEFEVLAWDLPGHGGSPPATAGYSIAELAELVLAAVDETVAGDEAGGAAEAGPFHYAGDSIGGAVGLRVLLDHPGRVSSATLLCTGARIGTPESWAERAARVRAGGVEAVVDGSRERWFAPGFTERQPGVAGSLLDALREVDAAGYAYACDAMAGFDVRERLTEIATPVLAVAGAHDQPTPVESLREIAEGVRHGRLVVLHDVAHLAPAESAARVACLIAAHTRTAAPSTAPSTAAGTTGTAAGTRAEAHAAGMRVRRAVLGDAHVDRATPAATDLTADFQDFITRYAWGEIWARPGLDRRSRSMITLTALVAGGHHEELALHLRGARANGLTDDEIKELLLQTAIYCGVPSANTAFRIAQRVLGELAGTEERQR